MASFRAIGKFGVFFVVVVAVQSVLAYKFKVFGYFDLPLIFSVYYGFILTNPIASILIGSSLGLMQDSLSGALLGTNGFSKTLIGFLASSAGTRFDVDQAITRIVALFLFTLVDAALIVTLAFLVAPTRPGDAIAVGGWLLAAVFNTLLGMILFGYHERWGNATA